MGDDKETIRYPEDVRDLADTFSNTNPYFDSKSDFYRLAAVYLAKEMGAEIDSELSEFIQQGDIDDLLEPDDSDSAEPRDQYFEVSAEVHSRCSAGDYDSAEELIREEYGPESVEHQMLMGHLQAIRQAD